MVLVVYNVAWTWLKYHVADAIDWCFNWFLERDSVFLYTNGAEMRWR